MSHDGVRRGLYISPFDGLASPALLAELAVSAEDAGWDGMFIWDHLLYADPVQAIADPWICLAAIAARTSRIALGPMVTPLARRRPAVVARQALSLDNLSGGRLILGFGLGEDGGKGELSKFGEELDARRRGEMLTEGLGVLRGLLSGAAVDHRGEHYVADGVTFLPGPARPTGIPIWTAAKWPNRKPLKRAAQYDGLFEIGFSSPDQLAQAVAEVSELRSGSTTPFEIVVDFPPGEDPAPWADAGATWFMTRISPWDRDLSDAREVERVQALAAAGPQP
jgi:alkanesulfonate monooxygenase SsuD/methylene tetrahydromethanopterin reductase-like flavin-dependent oxidoreductase (luciferase family)